MKLNLPKQRTIEVPTSLFKRFLAMVVDLFIINLVIITPFRSKMTIGLPEGTFTETYEFILTNPGMLD